MRSGIEFPHLQIYDSCCFYDMNELAGGCDDDFSEQELCKVWDAMICS